MKNQTPENIIFKISFFIVIIGIPLTCFCKDPGFKSIRNNNIQVLTTDPVGNSFANGKRIENSITSLINNAQSSVYMAVYNFDNRPVLDSLVNAKKRGLNVEIVGDYHELESAGYRELIQNGISLVAGNINAIQHNKFIIIDEKTLITGTGNISHSDFFNNDNHYLIIRDESISGIYKKEFRQMHNGFFSSIKSSFKMSPNQPETNLPVEVFFSPQESQTGTQHMIEKINAATDSIFYMIYAFSHDEIATALIKAARRGVRVYGIHDSSFVKGTSQEAARIYMAGFKNQTETYNTGPFVHADGNTKTFFINGIEHGGKMHCKTMIIDPETSHGVVLTGSFNWSNNAVENNDENLLSISDQTIISAIKHQWDQAWKISRPLNYAFSNISGDLGNFNDIYISEINWAGTSDGTSLLQDDDYIEIINNSSKPIDLTHWTITLSSYKSQVEKSYSLPDDNDGTPVPGALILPGEYRLMYGIKSGITSRAAANWHNGIKIPDSKKFYLPDADISITLYDRGMNLVDRVDIPYNLLEGFFDPVMKNSGSMNRRVQPDRRPDVGWYTSKVECLWPVCQSPYLYGSPGYKNEPPGPVSIKSVERNNNNSFRLTFSGPVNHCTGLSDYEVFSSSGNIPIENISVQTTSDELVFQIAGASNPVQMYGLRSRTYSEFQARAMFNNASDIFIGTDSGFSHSGDNGITFQHLPINGQEKLKIYQIIRDPATATIYLATADGLYFTLNNGLTFQKIYISPDPLSSIVFDVRINTNSLVVATADGLYIGDKVLQIFQKISATTMPFFSLYLSDSLLLAGGNNVINRYVAPFTAPPVAVSIDGNVHDIKLISSTYFVATSSGLYNSNDGLNFSPAFPGIFSNKSLNFVHNDLINNPVVLSHHQISGIYSTGIQTFDILAYQKPVNVNTIMQNGSNFFAAGDFGLMAGNTIDSLNILNQYSCSPEQALPAGSVVFSGNGTAMDQSSAKLLLNEISLVNTGTNGNNRDWIELIVMNSGTLKNIKIEYYDSSDKETLFGFPDMHVNSGDVLLIYMESAHDEKITISDDVTFIKSSPYKFYSTHTNLNRGDGLLVVSRNNSPGDALLYSNRDGHVISEFMQGGLQKAYFDILIQNLLTNPLPFPVKGWNEVIIQNSAVKIPGSGISRAISRTSYSPNFWTIQLNPTPGVK